MSKYKITKSEGRRYFIVFILTFIFFLSAMVIDNIFWITASPEWSTSHTVSNSIGSWTGAVSEYSFGDLMSYVFGYRVFTVLTHYRDIFSALVVSIGLALVVIFFNEVLGKRVFHRSFIK